MCMSHTSILTSNRNSIGANNQLCVSESCAMVWAGSELRFCARLCEEASTRRSAPGFDARGAEAQQRALSIVLVILGGTFAAQTVNQSCNHGSRDALLSSTWQKLGLAGVKDSGGSCHTVLDQRNMIPIIAAKRICCDTHDDRCEARGWTLRRD